MKHDWKSPARYALALCVTASIPACAVNLMTAECLIALHHRSVPRAIDRTIAAAEAEAKATCGGPVALDLSRIDGDPADYGSDPFDYECLPR